MTNRLPFDAHKFLSLPVNDGGDYFDVYGCGCAKGNFHMACGLERLDTPDMLRRYGHVEIETSQKTGLLFQVLDRAEAIHMGVQKCHEKGQRPQYAKLFLVRALRRFNLVDFVNDVPENVAQDLAKELVQ